MKLVVQPTNKNSNIDDIIRYQHDNDAGADIYLQEDVTVVPGVNKVPLGFSMVLPSGIAGFIFPRSSMMGENLRFNLAPVDADYKGEYHMIFYNAGDEFIMKKGTRICQLVLMPVIQATFVTHMSNIRDTNGVGSTGK